MKKTLSVIIVLIILICTFATVVCAESNDIVSLKEGDVCQFTDTIDHVGQYFLEITYKALPGRQISPQAQVTVTGNGEIWSQRIELTRIWRDDRKSDRFDTDIMGNEIVPEQVEITEWQTLRCGIDKESGTAAIELKTGNYEISVTSIGESFEVKKVKFVTNDLTAYNDYLSDIKTSQNGEAFIQQAEITTAKSHSSIIPTYDRSSYTVVPNEYSHLSLNIIGGSSYSENGQWVEWQIKAPDTGFYSVNFRYYQDGLRGLGVGRSIYIDGKIPYKELSNVLFPYAQNFSDFTVKDETGEPYLIYLEKGTHTMRLAVNIDHIEKQALRLEKMVQQCNAIYRDIVGVTGTSPDIYRDYYLDTELPELLPFFESATAELADIAEKIDETSLNDGGSQTTAIYEIIRIFNRFLKRPDKIAEGLNDLKAQIDSLADTMLTIESQPLTLDYITFTPQNKSVACTKTNIFKYIGFRMMMFIQSFTQDYGTATDGSADHTLEVWINSGDMLSTGTASGRDQMQIIRRLSDAGFTSSTGIGAKFSLVTTGESLVKAILADRGPDVALFVDEQTVANLALRGALADMAKMKNYNDCRKEYYDSAFIAYEFGDGVFAWPITQNYNMMFYRTDIFGELGFKAPDTWDELDNVIQRLAQHKLQVGISGGQDMFETLLLQSGANIYNDTLTASGLKENASVEAFTRWTDLFVKQGVPLSYSFLNRFRTGEMPLGIISYTMYNQLVATAPEITGQWKMVSIPGTADENGEINRTQSSTVTGTIIISDTQDLEAAYRFVEWWSSAQVQSEFGIQGEAILGKSARYNTANKAAMEKLNWTVDESRELKASWQYVTDIKQTGATYYVSRCISNAFRRAVYDYENPRDILYRYSDDIDREIERKLKQLEW